MHRLAFRKRMSSKSQEISVLQLESPSVNEFKDRLSLLNCSNEGRGNAAFFDNR